MDGPRAKRFALICASSIGDDPAMRTLYGLRCVTCAVGATLRL